MGDGPLGRDLFSDGYLRREQLHLPASMSPALKAVGRFWWLPLIGLLVGIVAAAALVRRQPPPIYTASDTVVVSSPSAPYLRTAQTQTTQTAGKGKPVKGKATPAPSSSTTVVPPDTQVLVNAANLYPQFIQSDEIRKLRVKLYGATPGRVTATALASSTNTYGVYHPSPLPLITVKTTSRQPQAASRLATNTVRAFGIWLLRRQKASAIPKSQRITIEQLRVRVQSSSSSKLALPLFAGALVLLGFCGLAVLLDRARPRREGALGDAAAVAHRRVA